MNSVRSVCSTRSNTSFCTASMRSMRLTTSSAKSSGRMASTRAACSGLIFESTTATVCGYSLASTSSCTLLELLPHVVAGVWISFSMT